MAPDRMSAKWRRGKAARYSQTRWQGDVQDHLQLPVVVGTLGEQMGFGKPKLAVSPNATVYPEGTIADRRSNSLGGQGIGLVAMARS